MPIQQAQDGGIVLPNHVYLIPSRKNMMIAAAEGAWAFNEKGLGSVHAMSHACGLGQGSG